MAGIAEIAVRLLARALLLTALAAAGVQAAEETWIFDVHSHTARGLDLERVIARMDAAGVGKIVLFARRQGTDEEVLGLHARHPGRVVPAVGFQNPGWLQQSVRFVDEVEGKLASGRFRWMGELLLRHYGVPELRAPDYDIPPDSELLGKVLALSARYGVPLTIHHEAEPGNIEAFRRALRQAPQALVVWAHWCGRATPEEARRFLEELPNLHCDLGASSGRRRYAREKNPLADESGRLRAEWKALIVAFPDRFLAAIDAVAPAHYENYEAWVKSLKRILAELPPEVGRKVAYENAERLLARWKARDPAAR